MASIGRILMVEDDPKDVELTLTALEDYHLANEVVVASFVAASTSSSAPST